jgi:methyl-accepting chemotaxis protein
MTNRTIFDKAVFVHAKWKHRLRRAIETGTSDWTVAETRQDDRCDFGQWLKDLPLSKKTAERYRELQTMHTEFHEAASEVLALALAGEKEEAQIAMARGSRFADVSAQLVLCLTKWAKSDAEEN